MNKEIENWKPIVGYEGLYEVSNNGNIRTVERKNNSNSSKIRAQKSKRNEKGQFK